MNIFLLLHLDVSECDIVVAAVPHIGLACHVDVRDIQPQAAYPYCFHKRVLASCLWLWLCC
jgi:hypothetical protein